MHLSKPLTKAITRILQIVAFAAVEKGMEYKGEQRCASVKPRCKHWSCSDWRKDIPQDKATSKSAKIKPIALVVIKLHLSEGISK